MNEFENEELFDLEDLENFIAPEAVINLVLDDDTELQCIILAQFMLPEENDIYNGYYIALLPIEGDDEENDVLVYRYDEDEDGAMILENIESDEEYELVAAAYEEIMKEMDLEGME
ncbi:MAG: DUF1292 domain-containing protein [Lachnospiraceae bacterium]|nr:DUF1292 domain-containing protein [Lachnospiraceae bacterium]